MLEAEGFVVECFGTRHRDTDSLAFSFERPHRRHLMPDRLTAFGVPGGPLRGEFAKGRAVQVDGHTVMPDDVLGPPAGKRLVVVGDVEATEGLDNRARGADALVIEAMFLARDAAIAWDHGHLTVAEAASFAARTGAGRCC